MLPDGDCDFVQILEVLLGQFTKPGGCHHICGGLHQSAGVTLTLS